MKMKLNCRCRATRCSILSSATESNARWRKARSQLVLNSLLCFFSVKKYSNTSAKILKSDLLLEFYDEALSALSRAKQLAY